MKDGKEKNARLLASLSAYLHAFVFPRKTRQWQWERQRRWPDMRVERKLSVVSVVHNSSRCADLRVRRGRECLARLAQRLPESLALIQTLLACIWWLPNPNRKGVGLKANLT